MTNPSQMAPEVFFTVCHGTSAPNAKTVARYEFKPAILHGYCRRRIKEEDFPGMTSDAEHNVRGTLVTGLNERDVRNLDRFEGGDYDRISVAVKVLEKDAGGAEGAAEGKAAAKGNVEGEEVQCMTYVYNSPEYLEDREWDFAEFYREKLKKWTRYEFVFDGM